MIMTSSYEGCGHFVNRPFWNFSVFKCIDKLFPEYIIWIEMMKISNIFILPSVSIVFYCSSTVCLLFVFCSKFDVPSEVQNVH